MVIVVRMATCNDKKQWQICSVFMGKKECSVSYLIQIVRSTGMTMKEIIHDKSVNVEIKEDSLWDCIKRCRSSFFSGVWYRARKIAFIQKTWRNQSHGHKGKQDAWICKRQNPQLSCKKKMKTCLRLRWTQSKREKDFKGWGLQTRFGSSRLARP